MSDSTATPAPADTPACASCDRHAQPGRQVLTATGWQTFDGCACTWEGTPEAAAAARRRRDRVERDMQVVDPATLADDDEDAA